MSFNTGPRVVIIRRDYTDSGLIVASGIVHADDASAWPTVDADAAMLATEAVPIDGADRVEYEVVQL